MTWTGRTRGPASRRWPLLAAAFVAAVGAAVAALVAAGALLVHPCLPGDGVVGSLGVRLALLQPGSDCPVGTLALDAGSPSARLVVLVALPVLLAHLATALAGVSVLVVARSVGRAVRSAVGSLAPRLPGAPGTRPRPVRAPAAGPTGAVATARPVGGVRRRGPPAPLPV